MTTIEETAICVAWHTDAMKFKRNGEIMQGVAFFYWHKACYKGSTLPNQDIRELSAKDIGPGGACIECGKLIGLRYD